MLEQQRAVATLQERERLARELHDGIGQTLAAAQFHVKAALDLFARGDAASVESFLHRIGEGIQEAKESIREYLNGVKAHVSQEGSLLSTLRRYLNHYSHEYGIHTELIAPTQFEQKRLSSAIETQLQPIIQEALVNVRRHSGAGSARIILAFSVCELRVTVEDDGKGFDPYKISEHSGFGFLSMQGRAEAAGASLEIDSAPGKGTRVIVRVPWRKGNQ
jgi:signal transduction histidine kinase